jgi:very-short-patch-repair endonuclease
MRSTRDGVVKARKLRREMTLPEVLLWQALRRGQIDDLRFRRQHPLGPYVLDFYCAPSRLAVEIDGAAHDHPDQAAHDIARDRWLSEQGISVLRFNAADVLDAARRLDVLATIAAAVLPPPPPDGGPPPPLRG